MPKTWTEIENDVRSKGWTPEEIAALKRRHWKENIQPDLQQKAFNEAEQGAVAKRFFDGEPKAKPTSEPKSPSVTFEAFEAKRKAVIGKADELIARGERILAEPVPNGVNSPRERRAPAPKKPAPLNPPSGTSQEPQEEKFGPQRPPMPAPAPRPIVGASRPPRIENGPPQIQHDSIQAARQAREPQPAPSPVAKPETPQWHPPQRRPGLDPGGAANQFGAGMLAPLVALNKAANIRNPYVEEAVTAEPRGLAGHAARMAGGVLSPSNLAVPGVGRTLPIAQRIIAQGIATAPAAGIESASSQYLRDGKVEPGKTLEDMGTGILFGSALSGAGHAAVAGARGLAALTRRPPQSPASGGATNPQIPPTSHAGPRVKTLRDDQLVGPNGRKVTAREPVMGTVPQEAEAVVRPYENIPEHVQQIHKRREAALKAIEKTDPSRTRRLANLRRKVRMAELELERYRHERAITDEGYSVPYAASEPEATSIVPSRDEVIRFVDEWIAGITDGSRPPVDEETLHRMLAFKNQSKKYGGGESLTPSEAAEWLAIKRLNMPKEGQPPVTRKQHDTRPEQGPGTAGPIEGTVGRARTPEEIKRDINEHLAAEWERTRGGEAYSYSDEWYANQDKLTRLQAELTKAEREARPLGGPEAPDAPASPTAEGRVPISNSLDANRPEADIKPTDANKQAGYPSITYPPEGEAPIPTGNVGDLSNGFRPHWRDYEKHWDDSIRAMWKMTEDEIAEQVGSYERLMRGPRGLMDDAAIERLKDLRKAFAMRLNQLRDERLADKGLTGKPSHSPDHPNAAALDDINERIQRMEGHLADPNRPANVTDMLKKTLADMKEQRAKLYLGLDLNHEPRGVTPMNLDKLDLRKAEGGEPPVSPGSKGPIEGKVPQDGRPPASSDTPDYPIVPGSQYSSIDRKPSGPEPNVPPPSEANKNAGFPPSAYPQEGEPGIKPPVSPSGGATTPDLPNRSEALKQFQAAMDKLEAGPRPKAALQGQLDELKRAKAQGYNVDDPIAEVEARLKKYDHPYEGGFAQFGKSKKKAAPYEAPIPETGTGLPVVGPTTALDKTHWIRKFDISEPRQKDILTQLAVVSAKEGKTHNPLTGKPLESVPFTAMREQARQVDPAWLDRVTRRGLERNNTLTPPERLALESYVKGLVREVDQQQRALDALSEFADPVKREKMLATVERLERDIKGTVDILWKSKSQDGRNLAYHRMLVEEAGFDPTFWLSRAQKEAGNILHPRLQKLVTALTTRGTDLEARLADAKRQGLGADAIAAIEAELTDVKVALGLAVSKAHRSGIGEIVSSFRKAGLLSGPRTLMRNVLGNTAMAGMEEVARGAAAVADWAMSLGTKRRTTAGWSPEAMAKGLKAARTKGVADFKEVMQFGADREAMIKLDFQRELNSGSKVLDTYVNTIFRFQNAQDRVFKAGAYMRSLEDQARVRAMNEVRANPSLNKGDRVKYWQDPANVTEDMRLQAVWESEVATFTNDNAFAAWVKSSRDPAVRFVVDQAVPFVKTPANIVARMLDYAVVGGVLKGLTSQRVRDAAMAATHREWALARKTILAGISAEEQRAIATLVGRGFVGAPLVALGMKGFRDGWLTGPWEDETGHANREKALGRSPVSIKLGGYWHQIGSINPAGNLLAVGAAMARDGGNPQKLITAAVKTMLDQPMLQGAKDTLQAFESPAQFVDRAWGKQAGSYIPTAVSDIARIADPDQVERYAVSGRDYIKDRWPGSHNKLPKEHTALGKTMPRPGLNTLNPFLSTPALEDSDSALRKLGKDRIKLSMPDRRGVTLNGKEKQDIPPEPYQDLVRESGTAGLKQLRRTLKRPWYGRLSPEDRQKEVSGIFEDARETAKYKLEKRMKARAKR